ncbi:glycoside hydrolase family 5 protein [candidate division KSB1 bacterium]|nr:glycoside hydrolase family 5 protein [candidate division KSB1 bacterium]
MRVLLPVILLFWVAILGGCQFHPNQPPNDDEDDKFVDVFEQNRRLYRSVNLGNALEAPNEGEWGVTLESEYFALIKDAGFTAVRIPVRWSNHAAVDSPYTISSSFLSRVDWALNQAESNDLAAIINMHHYQEIMVDPAGHKKRFLSLWGQIAAHFANRPHSVFFEVLNEPNANLTAGLWNEYLAEAIEVIRQTNPKRTIVVGTAEWGHAAGLEKLILPQADQNLIVTFHYYNPFEFTHQGAEWVDDSDKWLGTTWVGTANQKNAVNQDLDRAWLWAEQHSRPLFMGEFGAYSKADMQSRYLWTQHIARMAENRNISWAYWEFCAGFGVYNRENKQFNSLLNALIP